MFHLVYSRVRSYTSLAPKNSCFHLLKVHFHITLFALLCDCAFFISRLYTFLGENFRFCSFFLTADFDAQQAHAHAQAHQNRLDHDQARMAHLEQTIAHMGNTLNNLQNVPQPAPPTSVSS